MFNQIFPLTIVSSLRFFGLFIVLPIIGLYTDEFQTSAFLAGIAAGGYALTQIIFQTPFGIWSDRYNRKHIIGIGLIIFLIGSLICTIADDITTLIIGRFIQGAGAIGGVVSAQIADLVREEERNKAMAVMGAGIFISFILAMLLSPIIASYFGLNALFLLTSFLCALSLIILYTKVPDTPNVKYHFQTSKMSDILKNKNLLVMNLSAFLQKFLMIFAFVCISLALKNEFSIPSSDFWKIYAPSACLGVLAMGPISVLVQKKGYFKGAMLAGIFAFIVSYFFMALSLPSLYFTFFVTGVLIFFIGFAILEPIMQTLASRYPKAHQKGAALGVFTTLGYVGSALGGICGGWLYESIGLYHLSLIIAAVCLAWALILGFFLANPQNQKNLYLDIQTYHTDSLNVLDSVTGVIEWYINHTQQTIIIKYDDKHISEDQILQHLNKK